MEIIVCIKRVPNTGQTSVDSNGNLSAAGAQYILNPYDEYAIEQALKIKDKIPSARVTLLTVGPAEAETTLRDGIAFGADAGILLTDAAFEGLDSFHTTLVMAKAIQKFGKANLVICGNKSIDSDTWQTPPQLAAQLGWPQILFVKNVTEVSEQGVKAERTTEEGYDKVEGSFPLVISVVKEIGEPRLPSLKGKMNAKKAPVEKWDKAALGLSDADLSAKSFVVYGKYLTPKKRAGGKIFTGEAKQVVEEFIKTVRADGVL